MILLKVLKKKLKYIKMYFLSKFKVYLNEFDKHLIATIPNLINYLDAS